MYECTSVPASSVEKYTGLLTELSPIRLLRACVVTEHVLACVGRERERERERGRGRGRGREKGGKREGEREREGEEGRERKRERERERLSEATNGR